MKEYTGIIKKQGVNYNLGKTKITEDIRISSAAIYYNEAWGKRWQVETFCFSHDPRQRTFQVIHGSIYDDSVGPHATDSFVQRAWRVHQAIAKSLTKKFSV